MIKLITDDEGVPRCSWGSAPEIYRVYHDTEWGRPVTDDRGLFEKVCLEGFQAGLSWLTILRKRENFRAAFAGFAPEAVAGFDQTDVDRLMSDEGIVRNRAKIASTINNAGRALDLIDEVGSLSHYFWGWAPAGDEPPREIPAFTETSTALSKDLKKRGWSFVGPTTMYAFMQAMGLVNDHLAGCNARAGAEHQRAEFLEHLQAVL